MWVSSDPWGNILETSLKDFFSQERMRIFETSLEYIFGRSSWVQLTRKILDKGAFSKLLWKDLWKKVGKYVGKHQPCLTKESCVIIMWVSSDPWGNLPTTKRRVNYVDVPR